MNEPLRSVSDAAEAARTPARSAMPLPAIDVDNVSASYHVHLDGGWRAGLLDLFSRSGASDRIIPALRDITFDVPKGSVLGVIGRNGAGKSTLLRTISGVLQPEAGRITVRGRISNLAMGVGFNEGLTGRANIRLGGLAIGLDEDRLREISDEIADFAQLGEYLDFPVSSYSSGMRMRLAFAVAVHLDPEVLLIDEALIGGDTKFIAADRLEAERALRRGPHDRSRHPWAEHHPHDGDIRDLDARGSDRRERRSRRGRREVHALLPTRGEQISSGIRTERTPRPFRRAQYPDRPECLIDIPAGSE